MTPDEFIDKPFHEPGREVKASVEAKCLKCGDILTWQHRTDNIAKACTCLATLLDTDGSVTSPAVEIYNTWQLVL